MSDEPVPFYLQRQLVDDALSWFADADRRERDADERTKRIADAHARGWEQVAKAVNDGFRLLAQAVRDKR